MPVTILVDDADDAPCNLRCQRSGSATYCTHYGRCLASRLHDLRAHVDPRLRNRVVIRETCGQSDEGGHIRSRRRLDPASGAVIEEVDLFCKTLKFEALLGTDHAGR